MSKQQKRKEKIMTKPVKKDLEFGEVHEFLIEQGFEALPPGTGSHRVYKHPKLTKHITLAPHGRDISRAYIKSIQDAIEELESL